MEETIKKIINYAVWAPSGDNSQPWKFSLKGNQVSIFNLPEKDNPFLNFEQKGSYIAHGSLLENMNIIASNFGYKMDINLFPNESNRDLVAICTFEKTITEQDPLYDYILKRCTNRKPYENKSLSSDQFNNILISSKEVGYGKVVLIEEKEKMTKIATALSAMDQIALEEFYLHELFFKDIVWTEIEEKNKKSGLYLKTLELPLPIQYLFRVLKYWSVTKILNKIGFSKFAAKGNAQIYSKASALGVILVPNNTSKDYINAGRLMQRVWLKITKMDLSLQPVAGLLFLAQRVFVNKASDLSNEHINLTKDSYGKIKNIFKVNNETIAMLFRVGYGGEPSARSSRKEAIIKTQ